MFGSRAGVVVVVMVVVRVVLGKMSVRLGSKIKSRGDDDLENESIPSTYHKRRFSNANPSHLSKRKT